MAVKNLQAALDNVNTTYAELSSIVDDIVGRYTTELDTYVKSLSVRIEDLSLDALRIACLKLAGYSFTLGEVCSHSLLKAEIAETLTKEKQATEFNTADVKTAAEKTNVSIINSSEEICVNLIYDSVSETLKRKIDEVHRYIDAIKNVMISKQAEAKLSADYGSLSVDETQRTRLLEGVN